MLEVSYRLSVEVELYVLEKGDVFEYEGDLYLNTGVQSGGSTVWAINFKEDSLEELQYGIKVKPMKAKLTIFGPVTGDSV